MRWSTKKFAEDILWVCAEAKVSLPVALNKMQKMPQLIDCPIVTIEKLGGIILPDLFVGPHCNELANLWDQCVNTPKNKRLCRSRVKAVRQWFKNNGYLEGEK